MSLLMRSQAMARYFSPGISMPVYLLFFVTNRCNATCGHCFYWRELNKKTDELTIPEIDRLARSMGPLLQVTLTGGSPEMRKDLHEIAQCFHRHCRPKNLTICANGWFTDKIIEHARNILETCPGMTLTLGVSLDGLGGEHDKLRGLPGLFERVVKTFAGLRELRMLHPNLRLVSGIVVSALNQDRVGNTAQWAMDNLDLDMVKPILVRGKPKDPHALDISNKVYMQIAEDDQERLRSKTRQEATKFSLLMNAKEVVQRELIASIHQTGKSPVFCSAGKETTVVYPDGSIGGCELRQEKLGNLRDTGMDFRKLWHGALAGEFRKVIRKENCTCYHHCFLTPRVLKLPRFWPDLAKAVWRIRKSQAAVAPRAALENRGSLISGQPSSVGQPVETSSAG